jgi:hypothetical protein
LGATRGAYIYRVYPATAVEATTGIEPVHSSNEAVERDLRLMLLLALLIGRQRDT